MTKVAIERTRDQYALRAFDGDSVLVRVDGTIGVDLLLPETYAKELLVELRRVLVEQCHVNGDGSFETAEIALDVPVRLHLHPLQVEQLIARLAELPVVEVPTRS